MNLRSYQNEAVDAVIANWRDGNRRTLLNMATGTGKTICFSSVISRSLSPVRATLPCVQAPVPCLQVIGIC